MVMRRAQASLMDRGIGIVVVVVVIGAVGIPIVQSSLVTDTVSVTNESASPSSPFTFDALALDEAEEGVVDNANLEVFAKEQDTGNVVLLPDANVSVLDRTTEDINVTTGSDVINSTDDRYNVTYDGKPTGFIESGTARTVVDLLPLLLALALFVGSIALIQ